MKTRTPGRYSRYLSPDRALTRGYRHSRWLVISPPTITSPTVTNDLAGDPSFGVLPQDIIQHGIGYLVADFVRMSLGDRLRGEKKIPFCHLNSPVYDDLLNSEFGSAGDIQAAMFAANHCLLAD